MFNRRRLLTASGFALVPLAGCGTIGDDPDAENDTGDGDAGEAGTDAEGEADPEGTDGDGADGADDSETDDSEDDVDADDQDEGDGGPRTVTTLTDGDRVVELLTTDHFASVGEIRETDDEEFRYYMIVEVNEEGRESFERGLEESSAYDDHEGYTIRTHVDGEIVVEFPLDGELVERVESGDWEGQLMMFFRERENAEALRDDIEPG